MLNSIFKELPSKSWIPAIGSDSSSPLYGEKIDDARNWLSAANCDCLENIIVDCLPNLSARTTPTSKFLFCFKVAFGYSTLLVNEFTSFLDIIKSSFGVAPRL